MTLEKLLFNLGVLAVKSRASTDQEVQMAAVVLDTLISMLKAGKGHVLAEFAVTLTFEQIVHLPVKN